MKDPIDFKTNKGSRGLKNMLPLSEEGTERRC